ncbi:MULTISPECIES: tyrosine-type recombinase/integrase [Aliiruegeria]|uniref:Site-specific recombinase XerD n=1 Tax=Aliiruegeria lutimaris TaxID=571298 RepID=A0A1G9DMF3_9RHOB|nr:MULTISPECIES: site-specific integrase [Aliiruegeria]NDR55665.1 site-specific integrase [Pseudoruegeria sp. M32A2M]SDK65077.1 Site-specific recombinase XerD [Aliiruegeria lutimaris]
MKPSATWCLHLLNWPEVDRDAWNAAFVGEDWLDDAGPGFHLRPKTREKYAEEYGHWLAWLSDEGLLDPQAAPASRVTQEHLAAYATWMRDRVAPVTVRMRVEGLGHALALMDQAHSPEVFRKILDRLPKTPSRDKRRQLRDPVELIDLGHELMSRAENGAFGPPRYNAVGYRDGLIIALCANRPLRRSNLAALRIGVHLRNVAGVLRIVIPSEETKTRVPIDMSWPEPLLPALDRYADHWRPTLLGPHRDPGMLWISRWGGGALSAHTLACNIRRHTEEAFGVAISPHRFRDAAATMLAIRDPKNVRAAAAVLGHGSYETTQKHYNLARQLDAVRLLNDSVDAILCDKEVQ